MNLRLDLRLAQAYTSAAQRIRVMSEAWTQREIFCAACGAVVRRAPNNQRVLDFHCSGCSEEYELKSKQGAFARKVVDGAYETMIKRLQGCNNPNFFFLSYDRSNHEVVHFFVVPGHFFMPGIIERRKPLNSSARRADWVGCNILLDQIPQSGRIHYILNGRRVEEKTVLDAWQRTAFLKDTRLESRGWTVEIMRRVEQLAQDEFSLADVYRFEQELQQLYPGNNFVKDKIRQQLQILRDKNIIEFRGRGKYRRLPPP